MLSKKPRPLRVRVPEDLRPWLGIIADALDMTPSQCAVYLLRDAIDTRAASNPMYRARLKQRGALLVRPPVNLSSTTKE